MHQPPDSLERHDALSNLEAQLKRLLSKSEAQRALFAAIAKKQGREARLSFCEPGNKQLTKEAEVRTFSLYLPKCRTPTFAIYRIFNSKNLVLSR